MWVAGSQVTFLQTCCSHATPPKAPAHTDLTRIVAPATDSLGLGTVNANKEDAVDANVPVADLSLDGSDEVEPLRYRTGGYKSQPLFQQLC